MRTSIRALIHTFGFVLALLSTVPLIAADAPAIDPPLAVPRIPQAAGRIDVDGKLDDAAWQQAAVLDTFYETYPADNTEPAAKTVVYLTYDDHDFYVGIHAFDPEPGKIRAPFVERDAIVGTDDNIAVFLDTRNDRRSAVELRVNPRGNQTDAVFNDGTGNEDFSPDFFYDTAAQITGDGWTAEMRIPFSSLRYPRLAENRWGILVWRNYPRDQRYSFYSSPIPRATNCTICQSRELTGLTGLPGGGHFVAAPYVTGQQLGEPRDGLGSPIEDHDPEADAGLDFKWTPSASNALDATINPDFSQVESDVGQLAVNNQFAIFFPEKRPFFLEGLDLFDTRIQAVYTRTITDPKWGIRDTGKLGATSFTVLLTQDEGGGSVIIPGPTGNDLAPQEFSSDVLIGSLRRDFGASYLGLLVTARENDGGGYNRVAGPDFLWRRSETDQMTGQLLVSDTETPDRPDLYPGWDGRKLTSHAGHLEWLHTGRDWTWRATVQDFGEDFRADEGFVPQVGFRLGRYALYRNYYPQQGLFRRVSPYTILRYLESPDGELIQRQTNPGIQVQGLRNMAAGVELAVREQRRVGRQLLERSDVNWYFQYDPGRRFSRIGVSGVLGDAIDFANSRVGQGGDLSLLATVRPTDHLALDVNADRQWLDVNSGGRKGRLFTAQIERLKATYNFTARSFLRVIGEYLDINRDPSLYTFPVRAGSGSFAGSALFAYQINWQTVLFVGYADDRAQDNFGDLQPADRLVFVKVSYAFQR
ncbi:MAG TPA: DUF5916 domain-containing protein [Thermoanaerobaculia bacterium]|jgi:hypothetical protein|nr:DUF5916 domain-containing protein [Thermoanaerobaculia bacterium]